MTLPATPHTVSLQFADVNAMATTPIQNLSSATNVSADPNAPQPAVSAGALPPVQSKSGVVAFVQEEFAAGRPPYFLLDPTEDANINPASANYPYGDPTLTPAGQPTYIAAQSSLVYGPLNSGGGALPLNKGFGPASQAAVAAGQAPAHDPALPGRWVRLTSAVWLAPIP